MAKRAALSRERVVSGAVAVADAAGLSAVSMRSVARELGVEAMSLYHHVRSKDDLLDELADWAFAQVSSPRVGEPWREEMATNARSLREVLGEHPWALGLLESRRHPGPALLGHHDAVLGCLRSDGFDVPLAAHAFSVLDAYVYGFVLTEQSLPMEQGEDTEAFAAQLAPLMAAYPHLAENLAENVVGRDYAYGEEFDYGLELVLDGLAARLARATGDAARDAVGGRG